MSLSSIVVIGALLDERSPYLKKRENVLLSLMIRNTRFTYFIISISCIYFFVFIFFEFLICESSIRVKNHYKWYQNSF